MDRPDSYARNCLSPVFLNRIPDFFWDELHEWFDDKKTGSITLNFHKGEMKNLKLMEVKPG